MRIGIDARKLHDFGIGTYIRNLLRQLARQDRQTEFDVFCRPEDRDTLASLGEKFRPVVETAPTYSIAEQVRIPLAIKRGAFPIFAGETKGENVMGFGPGQEGWSRVLLMRYPTRRAILELLTDPAYGPIEPYKLMALEVVLAPTWAELVFPPFWVAAGAVLLLIFLATGWARAARSRD